MRTKNSIKNVIVSFVSTVLSILIGFIAQKIFIHYLGLDYLGINGLFNNIISMLSISELGIGTAIVYHLYKPIANNNQKEIKALMNFYRKSYIIISMIILVFGLIVLPFIPYIVGETTIMDNLYIIYLLFLFDTVFSYLLTYKRSILYANQQNYYIQIVHIIYTITLNVIQVALLFWTKNYYFYLIVKLIMRILENIVITGIVNKLYPYLKGKNDCQVSPDMKKDIFKKIKALVFHQIGSFLVLGTDNILISVFFGVTIVGLYSNYYMITNALNSVISQVFKSVTSAIGNLIVTEDKNKSYITYEKIYFFNFWVATFTSVCLFTIIDSFVTIWLGKEFVLSFGVLLAIVISYYFNIMKKSISAFKEAAGIVYEDRYVPLLESFVNIIFSILFAKLFGLAGIFIGTIASSLVLHLFSYPKYVYVPLFKKNYKTYFKKFIIDFLIFFFILMNTYGITRLIIIENIYLEFLKNVVLSVLLSNIILFLFYKKNDNFKFYVNLVTRRK